MNDRTDEIDRLKAENKRLDFLHRLDHSLADQWQKKNEVLHAEANINMREICRLREGLDIAGGALFRLKCSGIEDDEERAEVEHIRDAGLNAVKWALMKGRKDGSK